MDKTLRQNLNFQSTFQVSSNVYIDKKQPLKSGIKHRDLSG